MNKDLHVLASYGTSNWVILEYSCLDYISPFLQEYRTSLKGKLIDKLVMFTPPSQDLNEYIW